MVSAVQKSYRKNILREMKGNASRMVSLFGIVALGVMMLTGLMSIAPSMRSAAQKYYVQQNVFDLRVLSTLGLSDQDIDAIAATPGVEAVMPVKTLDLEANWQGQEERIVVQLQALQQDPAADTDANMNRLVLRSGRMPQAANECVVHVMGYQAEIAEGTVLTLPEDTEGTKTQGIYGGGAGAGPSAYLHRQREQHRGQRSAELHRLCDGRGIDGGLLHCLLYQAENAGPVR